MNRLFRHWDTDVIKTWDNQAAQGATIDDLREATVREYLHDVRSALRDLQDAPTIYRHMGITVPVNNHETPRNVGLLFFSDDPRRWFPGASIVSVQFAADRSGRCKPKRRGIVVLPCGARQAGRLS